MALDIQITAINQTSALERRRNRALLQTRQEAVNGNSTTLQTKDREAVEVSLPVSMHAGQIFLLTKLLTATDLRFYEFDGDVPAQCWHSGPSGSLSKE